MQSTQAISCISSILFVLVYITGICHHTRLIYKPLKQNHKLWTSFQTKAWTSVLICCETMIRKYMGKLMDIRMILAKSVPIYRSFNSLCPEKRTLSFLWCRKEHFLQEVHAIILGGGQAKSNAPYVCCIHLKAVQMQSHVFGQHDLIPCRDLRNSDFLTANFYVLTISNLRV